MPRKTFTHEGRRYSVQGKDELEIGKKIERKIKQIDSGMIIINKNTTVKKWSEEWLDTYKKPTVGTATYQNVKSIVDNHIIPVIGNQKIKDIKELHLQKILNAQAGKSKSFITKVKQTIQQIFAKAVKLKLIQYNPAEDLEMPKASDGSHRALTEKERKFIVELSETHPSGLWIKTMLYCGLRPQETAALQWRHIDLKNKVIKIDSAREARTNEIKGPKSKAGTRKIPIPKSLLLGLQEAKGQSSIFEYVFTQPTTGNRHTNSSMRCLWTSFKYALNVKMGTRVYRSQLIKPFAVADDLTPYCLRHTYCTDLQSAGVPLNIAREFMGHEDIALTSKIYTHQSEDSFKLAAKMIDNFHEPKKKFKKLRKNIKATKVAVIK